MPFKNQLVSLSLSLMVLAALGASEARAQNSQANAVDAGIVVGESSVGGGITHAFLWTAGSGIVDLGTLGAQTSRAVAVSGGTVVGDSATASGQLRAFVWTAAGGMVDIGTLAGGQTNVAAVSGGNVVGQSIISIPGEGASPHAFLWTAAGGMIDLGTLGGSLSSAVAVDGGSVVGYSTINATRSHAFLWTAADGMRDLGTFGVELYSSSRATAVSGEVVVGDSTFILVGGSPYMTHAFIWTEAGGLQDLGTFPGENYSTAIGVHDGKVAGTATKNGFFHAFLWTAAGGMQDLGTIGGSYSQARAMSGGSVVGDSSTAAGAIHAFLSVDGGPMQDLGTLGGSYSSARGVSGGNVVGVSQTSSGAYHAFLWTAADGMIDLGALLAPPTDVMASDAGTFGAVDVSWSPSPAQGVVAYEILYGTASLTYTGSIVVSDAAVTSYHVAGLENGVTYYFALKSITADGVKSPPSVEVSATPSTDTSDYERALVDLTDAQVALAKARAHGLTFDFGGEVGLRMTLEVRATVADVVAAAVARASASDLRVQAALAALARADAAIQSGDYVTAVKELRDAFKKAQGVL